MHLVKTSTQHRSAALAASRRGFTLIELLTVIAIIGILAAILIPTVGKVRRSAKESQATSNIRQTSLSLVAMANEFKGRIPGQMDAIRELAPGGNEGATNPDTGERYNWSDLLQKNMAGNIKARTEILINPVLVSASAGGKVNGAPGAYDRKEALPGSTLTTEWGANPYAMAQSLSAFQRMQSNGGALTLGNANLSRVVLLASSPAFEDYKGVAECMFKLFWGNDSNFMNPVNAPRIIPIATSGLDDEAGGVGYDLGGSSRNAALVAYMDGHVGRVAKGTFTYGHFYRKN